MGGISIFQLLLVLCVFMPILLTVFSNRAKGAEKFGWVILVVCFLWVGYAVFLIATKYLNQKKHQQA